MPAHDAERSALSIEPAHVYAYQLVDKKTVDGVFEQLAHGKPTVDRAIETVKGDASTVVMVDDYNVRHGDERINPKRAVETLLEVANDAGVPVQYLTREAAYAPAARAFAETMETNGQVRSHQGAAWLFAEEEMGHGNKLRFGIELYNKSKRGTPLACPLLATIFQCGRLGLALPESGFQAVTVDPNNLPEWRGWSDMPPLVCLDPEARPYVANRALSLLPIEASQDPASSLIAVESAVRVIMNAGLGEQSPAARMSYTFDRSPALAALVQLSLS